MALEQKAKVKFGAGSGIVVNLSPIITSLAIVGGA